MHILYLHQHFATRAGTWGTRSYELSRLLIEQGHQITMLCGWSDRSGLPYDPDQRVMEHEIDGIRVLALNVPYSQNMSYLRRIWAFVWFMLLAAGVALRQRKVDVIFATSTPLTIAVPAMIASVINHKPFVFEARDLWPDIPIGMGILRNPVLKFAARALEWVTYRRARHIVACSPGMKAGIVEKGIQPEKVTVIPNASDNDLFDVPPEVGQAFRAEHPNLGDGPLVVYTGTFGRVNHLEYLVKLAQHVRQIDPQIRFLLVGTGSEKPKIRALAKELGVLDDNLWIMDAVPRQEMPAILSAASLATSTVIQNPVLFHNSANKFFDALASGTPIAINHEGWQADLLREENAGLVLAGDDFEGATSTLVDAVHDPVGLDAMGKAAQRLARERFDRNKLAL
ncbi:MAG: glycosyltransferase family 4 protein, partial [Chloroflexi bacterium]|nr:glycosyltransferase family 4 protein [Chloroflexota bacterium]